MSFHFILLLLQDMFFAYIAAFGFGSISNPPFKALCAAACLGALGHGFRFFLINVYAINIVPASFSAAVCTGFLALLVAIKMRTPVEVFTFPAMLPMIPGIPAYNTMIYLVKFLSAEKSQAEVYLVKVFQNGFLALFILSALVLGILFPLLLFRRKCYSMTKGVPV